MSTPVPAEMPDRHPGADVDPVTGQPDRVVTPSAGNTGEVADDVMVPVEVPVEVAVQVPVAVAVPVEAGQPWSGTVIDAVPTTADEVAALVLTVPDVVRLHAGRFGEVATYLPGRRVTGIKLGEYDTEVHVVVAGQTPVRETAQQIHAAVATLLGTPVHVYIEDIAVG